MDSKERTTRQLAGIDASYGYGSTKPGEPNFCDRDPLVLHVNWLGEHYEFMSYAEVSRWVQKQRNENALRPGRPKEREGDYERVTIDIRKDLLRKLDTQRGGMSRREYVEQWLSR